jgi:hypothetical protein
MWNGVIDVDDLIALGVLPAWRPRAAPASVAAASRDQRAKPSDRTRLRVAPNETTPRVNDRRTLHAEGAGRALPMTTTTRSTVPRPP